MIAYFDCYAGASGDMILGALLDAGLPLERLRGEIAKLHLSHYALEVRQVAKQGIGGSQARVKIDQAHHGRHHRRLSQIREIIHQSDLAPGVKEQSTEIFLRLARAEAKIHRTEVEAVHFHEVGAMDAIIDVVGSVSGLAALGVDEIYCSPLNLGSGTLICDHGTLPVPAPATAELTRGKPVYASRIQGELLTPTGAAILTTLAAGFGPLPPMQAARIGYGAGRADLEIPNLLRLFIGQPQEKGEQKADDPPLQTVVLETNIDDMNPQIYDHLMERLLAEGALDLFLTPVQMKKNRPGIGLSVICRREDLEKLADILLAETTTIGLRWRLENRITARRILRSMETSYGPIQVKLALRHNRIINLTPEYDDCRRAAREKNLPLKQVMEEVRAEVRRQLDQADPDTRPSQQ